MTRVLIAEDQGMMRSALATLLDLEDDLEVVAQVGSGDAIVATALEVGAEVALLDIELPVLSGLDAAEQLRATMPDCVTVMLTTFDRPGYLQRALAAGARGFIVKDGPVDELAHSIRRVLAGDVVIDPALATAAVVMGPNPLTPRERDVLNAAADGSTVTDISSRTHLSDSTVRNYLSDAIGKTGTRNRMEAVRVARDNGWAATGSGRRPAPSSLRAFSGSGAPVEADAAHGKSGHLIVGAVGLAVVERAEEPTSGDAGPTAL
jgi:two-component system, NarL family, response regulator DesR